MISCILAFYIAGFSTRAAIAEAAGPLAPALAQGQDADALYARREDPASARAAEQLWLAQLTAQPQNFDAAWKLARARYWRGSHAPNAEAKPILEAGIEAGRAAAALRPERPEGHFWMAANMGALAESFGMRQGLKYRGAIRDSLLTVLKLAPAFQQGSADRALGRWYYKVPGLFGGSKTRSEAHLRRSLTYAPQSTASHFFLAETLFAMGRDTEARDELQRVLDAPIEPDWGPEDREFKLRALARLRTREIPSSNPKSQATRKLHLPNGSDNPRSPWNLELGAWDFAATTRPR
jgi:hypothetical protein